MIFMTREHYKEWKNKNKDIFEEIDRMNKRSNALFPDEEKMVTDYDILKIMLELEMKDFILDVRDSYYFDTEGFIYEATKRLLKFTMVLDQRRKKQRNSLPFLFVDKLLIPLLVTAIYDISVYNCWNDNRSLYDLICHLDATNEDILDPDLDQKIKVCNMAIWVDKCYKHARDYNPAKRKIIKIVNIQNDYSRVISLEDVYKLSEAIYKKLL